MKLIEQLFGTGNVLKDDENLGKVNYRLYVYQEIVEGEEGLKNTVGKIDSDKAFALFDKDKLILKTEDGRSIRFIVLNLEGDIKCAGNFFKKKGV